MSIEEAKRMIDLFTSVGARSFFLTKLDLLQHKIWAKLYTAVRVSILFPRRTLKAYFIGWPRASSRARRTAES